MCRNVTTTEKIETEICGKKFFLETVIERTRHMLISRRQNARKTKDS